MTDRKKPGVAFWATFVVVVGLAYPISFGPACWITSRTNIGASAIPVLYRPLTWGMTPANDTTFSRVIWWYAKIGAAENWEWGFFLAEVSSSGIPRIVWCWVPVESTPPPPYASPSTPTPPYASSPPSGEPADSSPEVRSDRNLAPDD